MVDGLALVPDSEIRNLAAPSDATFAIKGSYELLILVRFLDLKVLCELAATKIGTSNPPH